MIILVSGATGTHRRFWDNPRFGHLVTPRGGHAMRTINESGKPWGADNDAFGGWTIEKERMFSRMLGRICCEGVRETCRFIACPDVVGDAKTTLERFARWASIVRASRWPVALVAQDGLEDLPVPWDELDCLFIGGTDEFKPSLAAESLVIEAKRRGKWVHVGRINSLRRFRHFVELGADSSDGSSFSKWPDKYFPAAMRWLVRLEKQSTFLAATEAST